LFHHGRQSLISHLTKTLRGTANNRHAKRKDHDLAERMAETNDVESSALSDAKTADRNASDDAGTAGD
jgi:hypothetical protein